MKSAAALLVMVLLSTAVWADGKTWYGGFAVGSKLYMPYDGSALKALYKDTNSDVKATQDLGFTGELRVGHYFTPKLFTELQLQTESPRTFDLSTYSAVSRVALVQLAAQPMDALIAAGYNFLDSPDKSLSVGLRGGLGMVFAQLHSEIDVSGSNQTTDQKNNMASFAGGLFVRMGSVNEVADTSFELGYDFHVADTTVTGSTNWYDYSGISAKAVFTPKFF